MSKDSREATNTQILAEASEWLVEFETDEGDAEMRQRFLSAYDAKHSIKADGNKKATLIIGADDFPFPIPLVNNRTGWEFDAAAGRREICETRWRFIAAPMRQRGVTSAVPQTAYGFERAHPWGQCDAVVRNGPLVSGGSVTTVPVPPPVSGLRLKLAAV